MSFTPQDFRRTLGRFATGISVVTTRDPQGNFHGITVNSFTSVSLDPALVLICIDKKADSHTILPQSGIFCVNLLTERQQHLSDRFAGRYPAEQQKFDDIPYHFEATGAPVFEATLGFADCRVVQTYDAGDHTIFIGQVERIGYNDDSSEDGPLLYYKSAYRKF